MDVNTSHARLWLARVPIDAVDMTGAIDWLAQRIASSSEPLLVMGPNAHIVVTAKRDPGLQRALAAADLCVADGISVVMASRLLGTPVPQRVTGGDLMENLCRYASQSNLSVYFFGGLPGAAEKAAQELSARYPALRFAGCWCPPLGFELDPLLSEHALERIRAARPDILCVALGVPKQEIWMHQHVRSLPVRLAIAVGAALDTQAGLRKRAPRWSHRIGLEWLCRLVMEPRRLWRRYLIGNSIFVWIVLRAWLDQRLLALKPSVTPPGKPQRD